MVSYRFDDGREGFWKPELLLGVLRIIGSNQGQRVHDGTSPIYEALNSDYPEDKWWSTDADPPRSFMRDYSKPWTLTNLVFRPSDATPRGTFQITNYGNQMLNLPQNTAYRRILHDLRLEDEDLGQYYPFQRIAEALRDINTGQTDWPDDPYPISLDTFRSLLQNISNYADWNLIHSSDWSESSQNYNDKLFRRMRLIRTIIGDHLGLVNLGDDNSIVGINSEAVNQFLYLSSGTTITNQSNSSNANQSNSSNANTGNNLPAAAKEAIERRAVTIVQSHHELQGSEVQSVESPTDAMSILGIQNPGYDLHIHTVGGDEIHSEVKGTTSDGVVRVSRNEIATACVDIDAILSVVSNIEIECDNGEWLANGGDLREYRWIDTQQMHEAILLIENLSGVVRVDAQFVIDTNHCSLLEELD